MSSINVVQALRLIRDTPEEILQEHRREIVLTFNSIQSLLDHHPNPKEPDKCSCADSLSQHHRTPNTARDSTEQYSLPELPTRSEESSRIPIVRSSEETESNHSTSTSGAARSETLDRNARLPRPEQSFPQDGTTGILQALKKESVTIKAYLSRMPVDAVGKPEWNDEDFRVLDLKFSAPGPETTQTRFRKILSRRSLALQFDRWERERYGSSRIVEVAGNTLKMCWKGKSHIREHLNSQENSIKDVEAAYAGIQLGVKLLIIEQKLDTLQCASQEYTQAGLGAISAILGFACWRLRNLKLELLDSLVQKIFETTWIMEIVVEKRQWFEECQSVYEG